MLSIHYVKRNRRAVTVLVGLLTVQAFLFAGPCYMWVDISGCWSQGGTMCDIYKPPDNLECPGGPWTINDIAELGADINWPCDRNSVEHLVPHNASVSGDEPTGFMEQGHFSWVCSSEKSCEKQVIWYFPYEFACVQNKLVACRHVSRFSVGGAVCPLPPSGTGGTP